MLKRFTKGLLRWLRTVWTVAAIVAHLVSVPLVVIEIGMFLVEHPIHGQTLSS